MKNIYSIRPRGFNIGNDVIYLGVNHFLRLAFKERYNVISIPATAKYESHGKAGLSGKTVYEINQFGHGVVVGGGNLYENGELEVNPIALRALEKPLMVFSVSRGRVYNRKRELVDRTDTMDDQKLKTLHQYADISLSRDKATKDYLDSLGCDNILGGCPTLFIDEIPQHIVPILDSGKTDCLISIRTPSLMSIPVENQYAMRDEFLAMIDLLRSKGYQDIKFLCHDHRDIPFASSFEDVGYIYTEDVFTYLTYLRNTRLNLTFRLHSFIPCLAYDIPTIKVSYDQRALSMLDTIGMNEWNIDLMKDNLQQEIANRLDNLSDLEQIKAKARKNEWAELRNTMLTESEHFARLAQG